MTPMDRHALSKLIAYGESDQPPAAAGTTAAGQDQHEQMIETHVVWHGHATENDPSKVSRPICRYCWHEGPDGQPRRQDWPCLPFRTVSELLELRQALAASEARVAQLEAALEDLNQVGLDCIKDGSRENRHRLIEAVEWSMGVLKDRAALAASCRSTLTFNLDDVPEFQPTIRPEHWPTSDQPQATGDEVDV